VPNCWAANLDACSSEQSREHIVSEGIWAGEMVEVVGLPWCRNEPKRIGLSSLTAKILCRSHNSRLSPLDAAAKHAFDAVRQCVGLSNERDKLRPRRWKVRRFEIMGLLLERWFLKTAINVAVTHPEGMSWGLTGSPADQPPPEIVRMVYGTAEFVPPMGLYAVADPGEDFYSSDVLHSAPLLTPQQAIIGVFFVFRGFRFLLHLDPRRLPASIDLPTSLDARWRTGQVLYHPKELSFRVAKKRSHYIQILWHVLQ
jgi:hypothetical protein